VIIRNVTISQHLRPSAYGIFGHKLLLSNGSVLPSRSTLVDDTLQAAHELPGSHAALIISTKGMDSGLSHIQKLVWSNLNPRPVAHI
jgi:hypothetical protein